jgi:hypothetical protein
MNRQLYLLRIAVQDIEPEIWRRFVVPAGIPLDRLHDVIQIVMGWADNHLHEFVIGKKHFTETPESIEDGLDEGTVRLCDLITKNGQSLVYHYDFGDDWFHDVVLEDSHYTNEDLLSPVECLDGERACPPEDIGGIPGYEELCRELNEEMDDDEDEEDEGDDEDMWDDEEYDSEEFDLEMVNDELLIYQRWARDRKLSWNNDKS